MNQAMWAHPATQANLATLRTRGVICWGPAQGEQACGEVGEGRLLEPEELVECCVGHFATGALAGVRVVVTAGPTREPVDPVRFLGNRSSGKMGYALAQAAAEAGARVSLVSGPVQLEAPRGVEMISVETAQAMYAEVSARLADTDMFIGAAAVADYRPVQAASQKIKKGPRGLSLQLEATPDILAAVSASGRVKFVLGFAAETENLAANAQKKRLAKGLDLVAANWVGEQRGFDTDDNALELFWEGGQQSLALAPKARLARQLIEVVARRYREKLQRLEAAGRHAHHSA
jgi:phosphopantothenoylcysteine decarboxylase/phosphopantothenate--cysteine ligase